LHGALQPHRPQQLAHPLPQHDCEPQHAGSPQQSPAAAGWANSAQAATAKNIGTILITEFSLDDASLERVCV
jgi:hypothetical protein